MRDKERGNCVRAEDATPSAAGPNSVDRRSWLGGVGLGSLGALWANGLRAEAVVPLNKPRRARSVILIFNCGAPSHIDLWDPKPLAPDAVRGPCRTISTNVPGIHVSELLPRMAARADKLAIVRTVHHSHSSHNSGMYWSIVGRPYRIDNTLINPSPADFPSFGTLAGWLAQRNGYTGALPPYVITPKPHCDSLVYITPGQFGACLGSRFDPMVVNSDPNSPEFQVQNLGMAEGMTSQRFVERQALLASFERMSRPIRSELVKDIDVNRAKAARLVQSDAARAAFDLKRESDATRDRYGRHSWGQSHLLARRLVEAGVPFVTTVNGPSITWDTHKDNFSQLERRLVPPMEQAYAALLDDLSERGLLDTTLVVWMGDFGRTPLINIMPAATTGRAATRWCWPAAAFAAAKSSANRTRSAANRPSGQLRRPTSMPRSLAPWATTRARSLIAPPTAARSHSPTANRSANCCDCWPMAYFDASPIVRAADRMMRSEGMRRLHPSHRSSSRSSLAYGNQAVETIEDRMAGRRHGRSAA